MPTNILIGATQNALSTSIEVAEASGNDRVVIVAATQRRTTANIGSATLDGVAPSETVIEQSDGPYHVFCYKWNDGDIPATAGTYTAALSGVAVGSGIMAISMSDASQATPAAAVVGGGLTDDFTATLATGASDLALHFGIQNTTATWTHSAGSTLFLNDSTNGNSNDGSRSFGGSYEIGETAVGFTSSDTQSGAFAAFYIEDGAGDSTAPVLTSPTAGSLTTDGVTPSVTTDEGNGTLYWGIYADSASPTAAQVVAGTSAILSGSQAVSGTGSQGVSAQTGLDDATSYELFFVHDDAAANRSNLATVGFTTSTDSTAPSLTSPTAGSVTSTSVAPTVTTNTAEGTAYARVYADGATPTASQVQSGTGVTPVASATNITVGASGALVFSAITGLTEGTPYELYFAHVDAATTPNLSAVSTVGFTTTAAARSVELTGANGYELRDETGSVIASLNGIVWEWYDDPDSTTGAPTDSGTFNTSAGGEATITITGSGLANGAFGQLIIRHPTDDEIRGNYYLPITVS